MSKVAIITGGGSGIGRASAVALARTGWTTVVAGRRPEALHETAAMAGENSLAHPCDVTDPDGIGNLFDVTRDRFGRVDLLFNNAGVFLQPQSIEKISLADWKQSIDINLTGYFLGIQNAFRIMRAQDPQGGRIINNGSISAHAPRPNSVAYTATKHGVTGLTKSAALDGRRYGIACGQIDIGNAGSPLTADFQHGTRQADGSVRVEPTMDVSHVADAVVYMADLPLGANVQFMTVLATAMPYIGRG